jgi:hypothetical protein
MTTPLTRRRDPEAHAESWQIYYGDVRIGWIGLRAGVPVDVDQWGWSLGFYPGTEPCQQQSGTARSFKSARAAFRMAWRVTLPSLSEASFQRWREQRDWTAWKYQMWDHGRRMPTQNPNGRSRCFCGERITLATIDQHIRAAHRAAS